MCLALPAQVEHTDHETALVQMQGNRMKVCTVLVGSISPGEWVLVHAGFAIAKIDPQEAAETWEVLTEAATELAGDEPATEGQPK